MSITFGERSLVCLILLHLSYGSIAFADPLSSLFPSHSLTLQKGVGSFGLLFSYQHSGDFYDSSGTKQGTFSDNSQQSYHSFISTIASAYGLTDRLTLSLAIPIVYRKETKTFDAQDSGLGDVTTGARFRFFGAEDLSYEFAFELNGKFPTGDTDVSFSDPSTGKKAELPLGAGNSDISLGVLAKQHFGKRISLEEKIAYTFRLDALVEYLSTSSVGFTADDGTVFTLPIGNLKIDWGDEVWAGATLMWEVFPNFALASHVQYLYRRPTIIEDFLIAPNGASIDSSRQNINISSAHFLNIRPSLLSQITKDLKLAASVELPILGENYPTLYFVESMVGLRYQLELHYGF